MVLLKVVTYTSMYGYQYFYCCRKRTGILAFLFPQKKLKTYISYSFNHFIWHSWKHHEFSLYIKEDARREFMTHTLLCKDRCHAMF